MSGAEIEPSGRRLRDRFVTEERYVPAHARRNLYVTAAVLMVVGGVFFASLLVQVVSGIGIVALDRTTEKAFVQLRNPTLTTLDDVLAVIFGPVALPIIVLLLVIGWIVFARHLWRPLLLAGAMSLGVVIIQIVTRVVRRGRPPLDHMLFGKDTTYSFPSGHVCGTADFFLLLSFLVVSRTPTLRRILVAAVLCVVGIGSQIFARLYLGYHWLSDTLASVCLALVILGLVMAVDTWRTVRVPGEAVEGEFSTVQTEGS